MDRMTHTRDKFGVFFIWLTIPALGDDDFTGDGGEPVSASVPRFQTAEQRGKPTLKSLNVHAS